MMKTVCAASWDLICQADKHPGVAAWAQAIGAIIALVVAISSPLVVDYLKAREKRRMAIAAADFAYSRVAAVIAMAKDGGQFDTWFANGAYRDVLKIADETLVRFQECAGSREHALHTYLLFRHAISGVNDRCVELEGTRFAANNSPNRYNAITRLDAVGSAIDGQLAELKRYLRR